MDANVLFAANPKRSESEQDPYLVLFSKEKAKKQCCSEAIWELSGGNQGQGSALIISQFPKLVHYLKLADDTP